MTKGEIEVENSVSRSSFVPRNGAKVSYEWGPNLFLGGGGLYHILCIGIPRVGSTYRQVLYYSCYSFVSLFLASFCLFSLYLHSVRRHIRFNCCLLFQKYKKKLQFVLKQFCSLPFDNMRKTFFRVLIKDHGINKFWRKGH